MKSDVIVTCLAMSFASGGKRFKKPTQTNANRWIGWQFGVHSSEKTTEIDQKQIDGVGWIRSGRGLGEEGRKQPFSSFWISLEDAFLAGYESSHWMTFSDMKASQQLWFVSTKALQSIQWQIWHAINRWHNNFQWIVAGSVLPLLRLTGKRYGCDVT